MLLASVFFVLYKFRRVPYKGFSIFSVAMKFKKGARSGQIGPSLVDECLTSSITSIWGILANLILQESFTLCLFDSSNQ